MFGNRKKETLYDDNDFVMRCKIVRLDNLCKSTKFTKREIRLLYQGFKQECPSGAVSEEDFVEIFGQFFPQGDASDYAHYVFKTFKDGKGNKRKLYFEDFLTILSSLSRGTSVEKMRWIFNLYDINGDGFVTKQEMLIIGKAIFDMLGVSTRPAVDNFTVQDRIDSIFYQIDANKDGVITFDEFCDWCQKDDNRSNNLLMFDTVFL